MEPKCANLWWDYVLYSPHPPLLHACMRVWSRDETRLRTHPPLSHACTIPWVWEQDYELKWLLKEGGECIFESCDIFLSQTYSYLSSCSSYWSPGSRHTRWWEAYRVPWSKTFSAAARRRPTPHSHHQPQCTKIASTERRDTGRVCVRHRICQFYYSSLRFIATSTIQSDRDCLKKSWCYVNNNIYHTSNSR